MGRERDLELRFEHDYEIVRVADVLYVVTEAFGAMELSSFDYIKMFNEWCTGNNITSEESGHGRH